MLSAGSLGGGGIRWDAGLVGTPGVSVQAPLLTQLQGGRVQDSKSYRLSVRLPPKVEPAWTL